jgi:hypothetical protein
VIAQGSGDAGMAGQAQDGDGEVRKVAITRGPLAVRTREAYTCSHCYPPITGVLPRAPSRMTLPTPWRRGQTACSGHSRCSGPACFSPANCTEADDPVKSQRDA